MFVNARSIALAVVVSLLLVPALTRVHQRLEHTSNASTLISSYSKSGEAPPEKQVTAPPAVVVAILTIVAETAAPSTTRAQSRDIVLPSGPPFPPDGLRAPPLA